MKNVKLVVVFFVVAFVVAACSSNQPKQVEGGIEAPTQLEMAEFSEAAEKVSNMLQPKSASLVFTLDGTTYELNTKSVETSIIPFSMYRPANEEEGESEESSLIWMKGTDVATGVNVSFSVGLKEKLANGNFAADEGEIIISKEGKDQYCSVRKMSLNISKVVEKRFHKELSGYSLDMAFSGTVADFGPKGETHEITDGRYSLKY